MTRNRLLPVLIALVVAGCASTGTLDEPRQGVYDYRLTQADFQDAPYANMYEVINVLRGNWLQHSRVAVDGLLVGSVDELRRLRPGEVATVQLLNYHQAKTMFGMQMAFHRAILVTTKRGGRSTVASTAENGN